MYTKFLFGNLNSRDHDRDLSVDGRINAEMDLNPLNAKPQPDSTSQDCQAMFCSTNQGQIYECHISP